MDKVILYRQQVRLSRKIMLLYCNQLNAPTVSLWLDQRVYASTITNFPIGSSGQAGGKLAAECHRETRQIKQ